MHSLGIPRLQLLNTLSALFSVLFLCKSIAYAADDKAKDTPKAPLVTVEDVQTKELFDEITYPARTVSRVNAPVQSDIDGVVVEILTPLGSPIAAKSALFKIKNTDPVYDYVPVTVRAPLAGVLSSIDVSVGAMVRRGQQLATIIDPKQVRISVEVSASDLRHLKLGLQGEFLPLTGSGEKPLATRVVGFSPYPDPATGTATAELEFVASKSQPTATPLGLIGRVSFKLNHHQGIVVPESAIAYRGDETVLRLVANNKVKFSPVKILRTRRGQAEITGVASGQSFIVQSSAYVADGQDVSVQKSDVAKAP